MKRYPTPILTHSDIPGTTVVTSDVSSVFNPGAIKYNDKYYLVLRVQNRGRETLIMIAESNDGYEFNVREEVIYFHGIDSISETIYHIYDPRVTYVAEDDCHYIMLAMDMEGGCQLGLAKTTDFKHFDFIGNVSNSSDVRNGVLFPEKINGKYYRYERPNAALLDGGVTSGNAIHLAKSTDLINWDCGVEVMGGRFHYWDERIGSGPPPVKTKHGWLHVYHGIAEHFGAASIYQGGVVLTDLEDPSKVIKRSPYAIIEPRETWEMVGQVPQVVFPSGMIIENYDSEGFAKADSAVKIYYGAADTVIGLLETTIEELLDACEGELGVYPKSPV